MGSRFNTSYSVTVYFSSQFGKRSLGDSEVFNLKSEREPRPLGINYEKIYELNQTDDLYFRLDKVSFKDFFRVGRSDQKFSI